MVKKVHPAVYDTQYPLYSSRLHHFYIHVSQPVFLSLNCLIQIVFGLFTLDWLIILESRHGEFQYPLHGKFSPEYIWIAEVQDTFTNDEGEEQEINYKVAFYSKTIDSAMAYVKEYLRQGYDMKIVSLKKSNFVDVI